MSNTIILKNGTTTPGVTDLEVAEPGFKKDSGTLYIGNGEKVVQINPIISPEEPERIPGALWIDTSVESSTEESPLPILQGGTGANSAISARANLGAAPDGYGLGVQFPQSFSSLADLDTITRNGWYVISASGSTLAGVGFNHAMVFVQCRYGSIYQELVPIKSTTKLRRYKYDGTWSEWEVENPPMVLGVEYRTTKRRNGKVIYAKLVDFGALPSKTQKMVAYCSTGATGVFSLIATLSDGNVISAGYGRDRMFSAAYGIFLDVTTMNIRIVTEDDFSSISAVVAVEYTKD